MGIHDREYYRDEDAVRPVMDLRGNSMVTNLLIINCVVFLANLLLSNPGGAGGANWLVNELMANPSNVAEPWLWWKFVTSGFAHDPTDIRHLLFNMFVLWMFGRDVETRLGKREFLAFYLVAVVLPIVAHCAWKYALTDDNRPLLGASGAVTGVIILFALQDPHRPILFMMFLPMPAWVAAALIVVLDLLGGSGARDHVAHDVHLFGAAFGAVYFYSKLRISNWLPSSRGRGRGPRLRVHRPDDESIEAEGDRLLEKLHRDGEESLTRKERRQLKAYSRHLRRKRE